MPRSPHSDPYKVLLEVLQETRKDAGITQLDLSKRLKRPQSFFSKIETGERRLDLIEMVAIARAMKIDPQELFASILKKLPRSYDI